MSGSPCRTTATEAPATEVESLANSSGFLPSQLFDLGLHAAGGLNSKYQSDVVVLLKKKSLKAKDLLK